MYYQPERIFLCEFKYFALKPDFGAWGVGEKKVTTCLHVFMSLNKAALFC
jgi:hypothetical protein